MLDPVDESDLYRRVRVLRWALPPVVFFIATVIESHEFFDGRPIHPDFLIFGLLVPTLIWLVFTALVIGLRQRDAAQARLRILYRISAQVAGAPDAAALMEIAADMLGNLLGKGPASLMMREREGSQWILAEARHLLPDQEQAVTNFLLEQGTALPCALCPRRPGALVRDCALLQSMARGSAPAPSRAVICLPLADQQRFHALITAYVDRAPAGLEELQPLLASFGSGFATALERARLRARELEVFQRMESAAHQSQALPEVLYSILGDVARVYEARSSFIYAAAQDAELQELLLLCSWPAGQPAADHSELARRAMEAASWIVEEDVEPQQALAAALVANGAKLGALVLAGQPRDSLAEPVMLRVAAELIALVVRNSQLTAELESQAILEERTRLAGEVHDRVAQGLGYVNFKVQQIEQLMLMGRSDEGLEQLRELRKDAQGLYAETRLTIDDLRWPAGRGGELPARLEQYCREMSQRSGLAITASVQDGLRLSPRAEVQLIRIVQEALHNIQRHAAAERARVWLQRVDGTVCLTIEDDGQGFSLERTGQPGHFGLQIMRERAAAMGGEMTVNSSPGLGTRLEIVVPARET